MVCHDRMSSALVAYRRDMIDPEGPAPVYQQLAALLREQIERGDLPPNRAIPSVARLQQEHGLARGTVLHAVRTLVEEGIVYVVPGRGTFVKPAGGE
jgi:GntR family transcriptional regulator